MYQDLRGLHVLAFLCLITIASRGQQYSITFPSINACSGVLEDSGGPNTDYGNNENFVSTICPSVSDSSITLEFVVFNLSTLGPGPEDRLRIFDGSSTSAPLLGDFTGSSLLFDAITATSNNASGCLTLQFLSNSTGTGNFAAVISCGPPCAFPCDQDCPEPVAHLMGIGGSSTFCSEIGIQVDGGSSYGIDGALISSYIWSLNGVPFDTTSTPLHDLVPEFPGAQVVQLRVVDDEGCVSQQSDPLHLLMGGEATITLAEIPAVACTGSTVTLQAETFLSSILLPVGDCEYYGSGLNLPDALGPSFEGTISIGSAAPGSVVSELSDIPEICVSMEHSYMGDLVIQISCSTGQTVTLHEQGGGSTYLGGANDLDGYLSPEPGECWNYCWSAGSTNGTWVEAAMAGNTTFTGTPAGQALLPGTYESVQPMTGLYGCPKNGAWTLTIYDLWAADNGFLCNWCVDIGSGPGLVYDEVGPIPGTSPDSAFWIGEGIVNDAVQGGLADVTFSGPGAAELTFSMMDSYGCVHDTTVVIQVHDPTVDAGSTVDLCDGPTSFDATLLNASDCEFTITLFDSIGDGWQEAELIVTIDGVSVTYAITGPGMTEMPITLNVFNGPLLELSYVQATDFNDENSFILRDDLGNILYSSGSDPDAGQHYADLATCSWPDEISYSWSPSAGISDPDSITPVIFTTISGWYVLTATLPGISECTALDSVWVQSPGTTQMELTFNSATNTICTDASGHENYTWYWNGEPYDTTTGPCLSNVDHGIWSVIVTPSGGCVLASGDTLLCPVISITQNGNMLTVPDVTGSFTWSYNGELLTGLNGPSIILLDDGLYEVQVVIDDDCEGSASIQIISTDIVGSLQDHSSVIVYPNPSTGHFEVVGQGMAGKMVNLSVMDMTGRTVSTDHSMIADGRSHALLELEIAKGSYLLHVRDDSMTWVVRLVVQ